MIRLHIVVEGQTEEGFVNQVLAEHLGHFDVSTDARRVATSSRRGRFFRGGAVNYGQVRRDIERWMKEDQNADSCFTTMFDLYALPHDFPEYEVGAGVGDCYRRIDQLERAFKADIGDSRFYPYIQLHEFEALVLADPRALDWEFVEHGTAIARLVTMASAFESPEHINDRPDMAPSKRIIAEIPDYEGRKASAGPLVVSKIGLAAIRRRCLHFDGWVSLLEQLGQRPPY